MTTLMCERLSQVGWGGRKLGLLFVDADGHLDRTIGALAGHLQAGTRLVIDDYLTPVAKQGLVKSVVDAHCSAGYWRADEDAIIGEGTWLGVCEPSIADIAEGVERIVRLLESFEAGIEPPGYALALAGAIYGPGDDVLDPQRSRLTVLEDGAHLGPPHTPAKAIESFGAGAYAHWRQTLYFSASDGSDPLDNGRKYSVRTPQGGEVDLILYRALTLNPIRTANWGSESDHGQRALTEASAPEWPHWLRPTVRRTRRLVPPGLRTWLRRVFLKA